MHWLPAGLHSLNLGLGRSSSCFTTALCSPGCPAAGTLCTEACITLNQIEVESRKLSCKAEDEQSSTEQEDRRTWVRWYQKGRSPHSSAASMEAGAHISVSWAASPEGQSGWRRGNRTGSGLGVPHAPISVCCTSGGTGSTRRACCVLSLGCTNPHLPPQPAHHGVLVLVRVQVVHD